MVTLRTAANVRRPFLLRNVPDNVLRIPAGAVEAEVPEHFRLLGFAAVGVPGLRRLRLDFKVLQQYENVVPFCKAAAVLDALQQSAETLAGKHPIQQRQCFLRVRRGAFSAIAGRAVRR